MFSSQFNIPKQHYRVDTYPSVDDLHEYIEKASEVQGIKHCFYWVEPESEAQYTLSIHFAEKGGAPEWWMHETSEAGERMIWFYRTDDLSVVYPQILEAVGAPNPFEEEKEEVDGTLTSQLKADAGYATPGSTRQKSSKDENQKPPLTKLLSGELSITSISSILQTASQESATGRILIKGRQGECMVQLVHGAPVHATTPVQEGMEALLELFTWKQGSVNFITGTKPDKKTIQSPVDHILYKGAELVEDISFLQEHSIDEESVIRRTNTKVSEKEFEKIVLQGPPLGLELQKSFYKNVDSNRTLQDIATFLSLAPSQWIAITANLVRMEILQSPKGSTGKIEKPKEPAMAPSNNTNMPPLPTGQIPNSAPPLKNTDRIPANFQNQGVTLDRPPVDQVQNGSIPNNSFIDQGDTVDKKFANPATTVKKAQLPPAGAFKVGGNPSGALNEGTSPAVEAFMTSSTTVDIQTTIQIGIQEKEVRFDASQTKAVWTALTNNETGLLTLEAFQFFMEREFDRAFQTSSSLSLIVFAMRPQSGDTIQGGVESVRLVLEAIKKIKRSIDIFGHFGEKGYAIVIPGAPGQQAVQLVDKITTNLTKFSPALANKRPVIHFGIASVPTDATEVANLMNSAQVAMLEASKRNVTRIQFSELK